jgi:predicted MPP superfamily phosphohydrolase
VKDHVMLLALLFAGACLGHLVLMVASHNWWYGQPLPRHFGKVAHLTHGAAFVAGPVLMLACWGADLPALCGGAGGVGRWAVAAYVGLCWLAAGVLLPLDLARRNLRRRPEALAEEASRVVDVVKELGGLPPLPGRRGFLTRLPGNDVLRVDFSERTLRLKRLPRAWDGLTVLHVSDLHLSGVPPQAWYDHLLDRCAAWRPDLVAVTGDIADHDEHLPWIEPTLGRLRWNVAGFAILGNHDYWYDFAGIRRHLEATGLRYLGNGWQQIMVRGEPLVVIGQERPWNRDGPDLSGCPAGPFRLCLSHTPDNLPWARRHGVDLMLSGHVHGGQVRLPLVGSVLVPSKYGRRYDCGVFEEGPTVLHVSRGLGGEHPLRFRCLPEVTLLTLRCGDAPTGPGG